MNTKNVSRMKKRKENMIKMHLRRYIEYHLEVARRMDPIYMVLSLIPCARLWPWIGEEIKESSATFGVYKDWIGENLVGDDYKGIEKFLNQNQALVKRDEALKVYQKCMDGEYNFFHRP